MKNKNEDAHCGLLAGGNWIIDQVKMIDVYPQPEQLGNIRSQSQGTGGAPYNVLIDLANSGAPFPLLGAGLVGKDALGEQILEDCRRHKIDVRHLAPTAKAPTSYTDVMTEQGLAAGPSSTRAARTRSGAGTILDFSERRHAFFISVTCCCWTPWMSPTPSSAPRPPACWPRRRPPASRPASMS